MQSTGPEELIPPTHPPTPTPTHPPLASSSQILFYLAFFPLPTPAPNTQRPDRRAEEDRDKINGDRERQTNKDREREGGEELEAKKERGRQADTIQRESIGTSRKAISLKAHVWIFDRIRLFFKCIIYNVQIHAVGEVCTVNVYPRPFLFTTTLHNSVYLSTAFFSLPADVNVTLLLLIATFSTLLTRMTQTKRLSFILCLLGGIHNVF